MQRSQTLACTFNLIAFFRKPNILFPRWRTISFPSFQRFDQQPVLLHWNTELFCLLYFTLPVETCAQNLSIPFRWEPVRKKKKWVRAVAMKLTTCARNTMTCKENISLPQILQLFGNKGPEEAWQVQWAEQKERKQESSLKRITPSNFLLVFHNYYWFLKLLRKNTKTKTPFGVWIS